mmetsp:Transcript_30602/g.43424  ORF Transcript_30602/g.43424 Transcript_30602/m.43424 type:complete len:83 (-) Transcript_30602:53-301(-)
MCLICVSASVCLCFIDVLFPSSLHCSSLKLEHHWQHPLFVVVLRIHQYNLIRWNKETDGAVAAVVAAAVDDDGGGGVGFQHQ